MDRLELIQWMAACTGLAFIFALGAIVGSFLNVVAYRMPLGKSLVRPPSACPSCGTRLTWRENFPIFGWLLLRGRCRFCKSRVSPEYPIVELVVALLFASTFVLWFMDPSPLPLIGVSRWHWVPEWANAGVLRTFPYYLLILTMISVLVAVTLIDAKTFIIPIELPVLLGGVALVVHPAYALWLTLTETTHRVIEEPHAWVIPTASGPMLGLALGGGIGVAIAALLLHKGVIRRSFSDFEEWESGIRKDAEAARAELEAQRRAPGGEQKEEATAAPQGSGTPAVIRALFLAGPGLAGMLFGLTYGLPDGTTAGAQFGALGLLLGLAVGLLLRRSVAQDDSVSDEEFLAQTDDDHLWMLYPHARREMVWEILFLLPAALLAGLGLFLCSSMGPLGDFAAAPPLWLDALGGSVLGLLVGGGVVWGVRILGTFAFNKEAMGIGDVHLMAAVGATLGWIDPTLAFFLAPFTGILWFLLSGISKALFNRTGMHLPYGPQLALMTVAVVLAKPLAEDGLSRLMGRGIDLP